MGNIQPTWMGFRRDIYSLVWDVKREIDQNLFQELGIIPA